jgi:hypothetical protein
MNCRACGVPFANVETSVGLSDAVVATGNRRSRHEPLATINGNLLQAVESAVGISERYEQATLNVDLQAEGLYTLSGKIRMIYCGRFRCLPYLVRNGLAFGASVTFYLFTLMAYRFHSGRVTAFLFRCEGSVLTL